MFRERKEDALAIRVPERQRSGHQTREMEVQATMSILPSWIYEPLPYIYGGVGIFAAFTLDSMIGKLSGVLLISAGIVVGFLRYEYRSFQRQRRERLEWLNEQSRKKKTERQAWLRQQADDIRKDIERKNNDF
jgi:hypothetical protein